jgi:hypothetical protein
MASPLPEMAPSTKSSPEILKPDPMEAVLKARSKSPKPINRTVINSAAIQPNRPAA